MLLQIYNNSYTLCYIKQTNKIKIRMKKKLITQRPSQLTGLFAVALFLILAACGNNDNTNTSSSKDSTSTKTDTMKVVVTPEQKAARMKIYQEHLQRQQRYKDKMAMRKNNVKPKAGNTKVVQKNATAPSTKNAVVKTQTNADIGRNIGSQLCTGYLITYGQLQLLPAFMPGKQRSNKARIGINIYDAIMPGNGGALDTGFVFAPADSATNYPDTISTDINQFYFLSNGLCPQDCDLAVSSPAANVTPYTAAQKGVAGSYGAESNTNMLGLNMAILTKIFLIPSLSGVQITFGTLEDGTVVIDYVPLGAGGVFDGSADILTDNTPVASLMLLPNPGGK